MKSLRGILVLSGILAIAVPVIAQEKPLDQQAMKEMMEKFAAPGEMHKKLDPFVGAFDVAATMWMAPGAEAMTSKGTSKNEWIMGGRYVAQHYEGSFMDQKFKGLGLTGYDNVRKEYISTWLDSMGTAIMVATGNLEGNTWTYKSTMDDPMSGSEIDVLEKIILTDQDHHSMEMWMSGPDGKMFKTMQIDYTRAE